MRRGLLVSTVGLLHNKLDVYKKAVTLFNMKYRYMQATTFKGDVADIINRWGESGWEFVTAIPVTEGGGYTSSIIILFRKPAT